MVCLYIIENKSNISVFVNGYFLPINQLRIGYEMGKYYRNKLTKKAITKLNADDELLNDENDIEKALEYLCKCSG